MSESWVPCSRLALVAYSSQRTRLSVSPSTSAEHHAFEAGRGVKHRGVLERVPIVNRFPSLWENSTHVRVFFACFQKTQGRLQKKLKPIFGKKNPQGYGGNFRYQEKTSIFFDKNLQNSFKSSMNFHSFWGISPKFEQFMWNVPTKQRIFQNILGIRKVFPKNTQGFEKKLFCKKIPLKLLKFWEIFSI